MTDAERVLALLIHDVRTPLGVAHGYLRLLRGDKLPTPEDRQRALASTQDALARISRLCQDAGVFLEEPANPAAGRAPAAHLIARVTALLSERGAAVSVPQAAPGTVPVGTSMDRAAEAIATVLATRAGKAPGTPVAVDVSAGNLRFTVGGSARLDNTPADGPEKPYDPWHGSQGLGVIVAHRLVTTLGGRVGLAGDGLALALVMPMETGNE